MMKIRALVEGRGGKWPDDERMVFVNDKLELLYSEVPAELKKEYQLPDELVDFYSRAEALFQTNMNIEGN
jgi:hypothetical protein